MEVLAIISRDLEKASTKYRLVQYLDYLRTKGFSFHFAKRADIDSHTVKRASHADLLLNQKCLFRRGLARKLIKKSRRVVFDLDDAIYTRPGKPYPFITKLRVKRRLRLWLQTADVVTVSNHFLAQYARRFSDGVEVIPMALDLNMWRPVQKHNTEKITIGWAGAPVNIPLVERLEPVLMRILNAFPYLTLAIYSGKKPRLNCPFAHHPFQPGEEHTFVKGLDIGLLPLADDMFSKGKSPIKAIQYLACGVPVVGNVVGATGEILNEQNSLAVKTEEEWFKALKSLVTDRASIKSMGHAGRQHALRHFDREAVAKKFENVLAA